MEKWLRATIIMERLTFLTVLSYCAVAMAPLLFDDQINTAALAGTWLGTLFTAVGLIALISQIKSLMAGLQQSRKALMARSAGDWAALIPTNNMPRHAVVEAVAPAFLGWFQRAYLENTSLSMTWDYRKGSGTSSWSSLFAHCGIKPADQVKYGGPDSRIYPAVTGDLGPGAAPRLADLVFQEGRVAYGFSQNEFAALLIICGFRISDFSISGCSTAVGFLGSMTVADEGPFSQVARFDPHDGCRSITEDLERYVNILPVQTCVEYALGLLRTPGRGVHRVIIPAAMPAGDDASSPLSSWTTKPRAAQLEQIKYSLEQLASVSGADVLNYSTETAADIEYKRATMRGISPNVSLSDEKNHQALLIAHALAALQPWGLLPVLPSHFVQAFKPLIAPFVGSHSETVAVLQERMCMAKLRPLEGWDSIEQQAAALSQVGDIRTHFFSCSNSPCRQYFKAMNMVFGSCAIDIADVRSALAARAVAELLDGDGLADDFVGNLESHLGQGRRPEDVPAWAVSVYATYLWGWLSDSVEMDFNFRGRFKRRVFLM